MFVAFDPGTKLGVATFGSGSNAPKPFLVDLKSRTDGALFLKAYQYAMDILGPGDRVAIEAPIIVAGGKDDKSKKRNIQSPVTLFGIRGILLLACEQRKVEIAHEVPSAQWRKHFIGRGRAPTEVPAKQRRAWLKKAAQDMVRSKWGLDVSQDEADALGILDYMMAADNFGGRRDEIETPLFAGLGQHGTARGEL